MDFSKIYLFLSKIQFFCVLNKLPLDFLVNIYYNKDVKEVILLATIRDVAKKANVSVATVSRILNNDTTLSTSPETKQRVLNAANELNYIKKKKVISSPNCTIGILQWFSAVQEMEDQYYLMMRHGIEDCCAQNKINIIRKFKTDMDYLEALSEVDGLLCLGKFSKQEIQELKNITDNIVFLDMPVEDADITSITLDFKQAVTCALDYLNNLGHKKIGFLGGIETIEDNSSLPDERLGIFKEYCEANSIEYKEYIGMTEFNISSAHNAMCDMIDKGNLPTAIFAASDPIAIGAMRALQDRGYRVPEDISIIGFDNTEISNYTNPPLTTMSAPVYAMGMYGVSIVYNMVTSGQKSIPSPMRIKLPCKIEIRNSCKEV